MKPVTFTYKLRPTDVSAIHAALRNLLHETENANCPDNPAQARAAREEKQLRATFRRFCAQQRRNEMGHP